LYHDNTKLLTSGSLNDIINQIKETVEDIKEIISDIREKTQNIKDIVQTIKDLKDRLYNDVEKKEEQGAR
jgi:methyl-accepting chemotaxis protein